MHIGLLERKLCETCPQNVQLRVSEDGSNIVMAFSSTESLRPEGDVERGVRYRQELDAMGHRPLPGISLEAAHAFEPHQEAQLRDMQLADQQRYDDTRGSLLRGLRRIDERRRRGERDPEPVLDARGYYNNERLKPVFDDKNKARLGLREALKKSDVRVGDLFIAIKEKVGIDRSSEVTITLPHSACNDEKTLAQAIGQSGILHQLGQSTRIHKRHEPQLPRYSIGE